MSLIYDLDMGNTMEKWLMSLMSGVVQFSTASYRV